MRALRISRGRTTRKLEPKVMQLLVCLASRPGQVVTRQELEDELWGKVVVGYESLTRAVARLRNAFDDDTHKPQVIETVPKVGYRLIAGVAPVPGCGSSVPGQQSPPHVTLRHPRPLVLAGVTLLLVVVTGGLLWWQPWTPAVAPARLDEMAFSLPEKPSIAVLPISNLSRDPAQAPLADAFTDLMITELSRFPELFVVSRSSTFEYKDKPVRPRRVAEELGVRYVVEGSLQRSNNRVRINVQLIDAIKGNHVWAERYDRRIDDLFAVQDEIVRTVVATLFGRVVDHERKRIRQMDPEFLKAYEYTERGAELYVRWTEETVREARKLLEKAIELDPSYLRAYKWLTAVYRDGHRLGWLDMPREEALQRARETAEKALAIDSSNYNAHQAMHLVHKQEGNLQEALNELEKALELNPNNAFLIWDTGDPLVGMGRFDESISRFKEAMRLNPHHPDWWYWNLAWAQYAAGRCEEALKSMQQMKPFPNMARRTLGPIHVCLGDVDKAREVMQEFLKHKPGYTVEDYRRFLGGRLKQEIIDRHLEHLRQAGVPEGPSN